MSRLIPPTFTLLKPTELFSAHGPVGPADAMRTFVSHNDIGFNYMERGQLQVLLSTGYRYVLKSGRLAVFWGAVPHKVEDIPPKSLLHWLRLPLGTFLRWRLPAEFTRQLMQGRVFIQEDPAMGRSDLALLNRWHKDIVSREPDAMAIVHLELEARLRRLIRACPDPWSIKAIVPGERSSESERMLLMIAEHFREPELDTAEVAAAVGLHRDYAGRLFRKRLGMGLSGYITECRLSHARAMLATGNATILDVAMRSGFGSVSQFHVIFKRHIGCTPRAYRASLRQPRVGKPTNEDGADG